jgi:hypothetical protein
MFNKQVAEGRGSCGDSLSLGGSEADHRRLLSATTNDTYLARYAAAAVIGNLLFLAAVLSPRIALAFTAASIIALVVLKLVQPRKPVRPMPMKYRLPGE